MCEKVSVMISIKDFIQMQDIRRHLCLIRVQEYFLLYWEHGKDSIKKTQKTKKNNNNK